MTIPQQTTFLPTVKSKNTIKTTAGITKELSHAPSGVKCERKEAPMSSSQGSTVPPPGTLAECNMTGVLQTPSDEVDEEPIHQSSKMFDAYRLIDITPTKQKHHYGPGRPRKTILDTYLRKCYQPSMPGKHLYRCIGCNMTFSNRNLQRTLKHARVCTRVPKELRLRAKELT